MTSIDNLQVPTLKLEEDSANRLAAYLNIVSGLIFELVEQSKLKKPEFTGRASDLAEGIADVSEMAGAAIILSKVSNAITVE